MILSQKRLLFICLFVLPLVVYVVIIIINLTINLVNDWDIFLFIFCLEVVLKTQLVF